MLTRATGVECGANAPHSTPVALVVLCRLWRQREKREETSTCKGAAFQAAGKLGMTHKEEKMACLAGRIPSQTCHLLFLFGGAAFQAAEKVEMTQSKIAKKELMRYHLKGIFPHGANPLLQSTTIRNHMCPTP